MCAVLCFTLLGQNDLNYDLSADGPYIIYDSTEVQNIQVDRSGNLSITRYASLPSKYTVHVASHIGNHQFDVPLHALKRQNWKTETRDKIFVISDPHGDVDCFISILRGGKVIDSAYRWIFGKNCLVVIGDVFDRCDDVLPIYWLIYKLEAEAEAAGGQVTFVLGNHEEMVLKNDLRYVRSKYTRLADSLHRSYASLWTENSELGRWLKTKNTIQVIGNNLFVHAGLSRDFFDKRFDIGMVNDTISAYLQKSSSERSASPTAKFLFGSNGPLWYRGMVLTNSKYKPVNNADVDNILQFYSVQRIFVGHTILDSPTGFYQNKVVGVNVENDENRESEKARAILIEGAKLRLVYDSGTSLDKF
ncbi:hypothetical protein FACS1894201_04560 [Bacteroidia bacterium]|nr:hypothetical protein FACS1894201_04560 [Bacteroidia bacterium]